MTARYLAGGTSFLAALLGSTAAWADLKAEDVWQNWVSYYESSGMTISGQQARDGDTLVVSGVTMTSEVPDSSVRADLGEIRMRETGNGRVEVTFPAEMPMSITTKSPSGETGVTTLAMTQTGMSLVASGAPDNMTYDVTAPDVKIMLKELTVDGTAVPMTFDIAMSGIKGTSTVAGTGTKTLSQNMAMDKIAFNVAASDPSAGGNFSAAGEYAGMTFTGSGTLPAETDMADMNKALADGFAFDGTFGYTGGSAKFDFTDQTGSGSGTFSDQGGSFKVGMGATGLAYGGGSKGLNASMTVPDMPFPIEFSMGESLFNIQMPLRKSDSAQPVGLTLKLVDLAVSDGIWGMIDPTAQLPHDPATLIVDVTGTGKLGFDLLDPALQAPGATPPENPGTVESLDIKELLLRAVGAELSGTGAFTFDNSMGMPMPLGTAELKLKGANALITKLVAMGIIPEDQAMGAQMMLGMFAVPSGEDELTSKIEAKEGGQIFVNGAPLPPMFQ